MNPRYWPDINNYTGHFAAQQLASAGALLVGVLATDGAKFTSLAHATQSRAAHDAGLNVWHYHFARPEDTASTVGAEALHLWTTVRPVWQAGDRLVLDVERMHPDGPAALTEYVRRLDQAVYRVTGLLGGDRIAPTVYMPDSLFRTCGPRLQVVSGEFWIASWGGTVRPLGRHRRMVAQQINNGVQGQGPFGCPGVSSPVDMNRLQYWALRRLRRERRARAKARKD